MKQDTRVFCVALGILVILLAVALGLGFGLKSYVDSKTDNIAYADYVSGSLNNRAFTFNQLYNGSLTATNIHIFTTLVTDGNYIEFSFITPSDTYFTYNLSNLVDGHKYLYLINADISNYRINFIGNNGLTSNYFFATYHTGDSNSFLFNRKSDNVLFKFVGYLNFFDLTSIYGSGNEPSDIIQFRSDFPLDFYNYTSGTIWNNYGALESYQLGYNEGIRIGEGEYQLGYNAGYQAGSISTNWWRDIYHTTPFIYDDSNNSGTLSSIASTLGNQYVLNMSLNRDYGIKFNLTEVIPSGCNIKLYLRVDSNPPDSDEFCLPFLIGSLNSSGVYNVYAQFYESTDWDNYTYYESAPNELVPDYYIINFTTTEALTNICFNFLGVQETEIMFYDFMISTNYNESAYQNIYDTALQNGISQGKNAGYLEGYNAGFAAGSDNDTNFIGLVSAPIDATLSIFDSLFNWELLGVNLKGFISALFSLIIIIGLVRIFLA